MRADVRSYIKSCELCQAVKPSNHAPFGVMASTPSLKRGDALSCDLIGHLPTSKKGNEHALLIIDEFSRNIKIFPLRKATTLAVCDRLMGSQKVSAATMAHSLLVDWGTMSAKC
jgi:hypothetical protein